MRGGRLFRIIGVKSRFSIWVKFRLNIRLTFGSLVKSRIHRTRNLSLKHVLFVSID